MRFFDRSATISTTKLKVIAAPLWGFRQAWATVTNLVRVSHTSEQIRR